MLGKYERLDVLGHGASSIVYLARDTLLRRTVAIKEIAAQGEEKTRFLEEARVLDRLRHPNIVRVNSVDTIGSKVVIDMEFVEGRNLQEILRDADGPLPASYALDVAIQVCEGLAFAHANHTVHRDIKPANILISGDGGVKLVDFGLAEVLGTNSYAGGAGTYAYMAPEDFDGDARSDAQSDLWSVGVILYEMVTGRRPFSVARPKDPFAWMRAISEENIPPPSTIIVGLPEEIDRIALKALARDKSQRYQTAAQLSYDLMNLRETAALPGEPAVVGDSLRVAQVAAGELPSSPSAGISSRSNPSVFESYTSESPTLLGAGDIDQFLTAVTDQWDDGKIALISGVLARWLVDLGEEPLARVASTIQADSTTDDDQKLREFLYRAGVDTIGTARREAGIGSRLLRAGAYAEAVTLLRKAINLDPNHPSYYLLLSRALASLNDSAGSILVIESAIERFPRHGALRRELRARGGARAALSQDSVDFGVLRQGQTRLQRILLRNVGDGILQGRVASLPSWIQITPMTFATRHRQPLTLVADAAQLIDGPGQYSDIVALETTGGRLEVTVSCRSLPARREFSEIYAWYLTLFGLTLLPLVVSLLETLVTRTPTVTHPIYIAGLIVSGLLNASLLAIAISSDSGWGERLLPAVSTLMAPLGVGLLFRAVNHLSMRHEMWPVVVQCLLPCLVMLALQGATMVRSPQSAGRWQLWCWILGVTALALSFVLWQSPAWNGLVPMGR
jgi:serine/threonine-protein kinase